MPERRIFARHTPTALTYVSAGNANGGILLNVSEAGCALQLVSPPPTLSDVSLDLDLGSTLPRIEVGGKVIWADETGCTGVRFTQLSEVARQTIRRFVENNPTEAAMPEIGAELEQEMAAVGEPIAEPQHDSVIAEPEPETEEALFDSVDEKSFEQRLHELSTGAAFVALVEECRSTTGASSAAIALLKGREMLCRASCGKGAPPTGARLDITSERSFTAQCVSTATTLRCVDSQIDPRVNAAVCQRLGIRSVTAMPLIHKDQVVGVLEVFSSERNAFRDDHITSLGRLGNLAVEFAFARNEITLPPQGPVAAWPASIKPATPRAPERPPAPSAPAVTRPPVSFGSSFTGAAAAVAVAPVIASEATTAAATAIAPQVEAPQPRPIEVAPAVEKKPELKPEAQIQAKPEVKVEIPVAANSAPAPAASVAPAATLAPIFGQVRSSSIAVPPIAAPRDVKPEIKPEPAVPAAKAEPRAAEPVGTRPTSSAPVVQAPAPAIRPLETAKPVMASATAAPQPARKESVSERSAVPAVEKRAEPAKPAPVAAAKAAAAPKPKKQEDRFEVAPLAEDPLPAWSSQIATGTHETVFSSTETTSRRNIPMIAGAALIVAALIGAGIWRFGATAKPTPQPQSAAAPAPQTPAVQEVQVTAPASESPTDSSSSSKSSAKDKEKKDNKDIQASKDKESKAASSSDDSANKRIDTSSSKTSSKEPQVIALAQSSGLHTQQGAAVAPPRITSPTALPTLIGANTTPSLPSLTPSQPVNSGPLKVSSAALSDRLIRRLEPQYPEIARRSGLSGSVRLRLEIGTDGKVKSAAVLEGAPVLAAAAKDAVLQWRYRPYVVENRPVAIETEIIVRFTAR